MKAEGAWRLTYDATTDVAYLSFRSFRATGPADALGPTLLLEHDRDFARTSSGSPLRVDRIDLAGIEGFIGGSLGITLLPGKKREGHTGLHWRDLELDVARLRALGVGVLLLLVEDEELAWCRVPELPEVIPAAGIELVRFPIRDPGSRPTTPRSAEGVVV